VVSRGLLVLLLPGLVLGSPGSPAQEVKAAPPPGRPDGPPPGEEAASPDGTPEREGKVRKERRPESKPGGRREGPQPEPPGLDPDPLRIDARVREIQLALLDEIVRVEDRLSMIRRRLEIELGLPGPPLPAGAPAPPVLGPAPGPEGPASTRKQARRAVRVGRTPEDLAEERQYGLLLDREREIVTQWKKKAAGDSGAEKEKADLRRDLERVLREMLDLRERARERQLDRLRQELEDIHRALKVREDEKERERLVKARARELLEK